ncbi:hypothetical protein KY349_05670 [Candidatus Woesearchaeota archaeon]|nr:hypothetical protein [Candidatus Woesearchaeota archaeon]
MPEIQDYTNADVTDISPTNKVVIKKRNPRYKPFYGKVDEPQWVFEMITFDELEELRSTVDKTLEQEVKRLQSSGQTGKTKEVYFLEHNQANLARITEKAYKLRETKHTEYVERPIVFFPKPRAVLRTEAINREIRLEENYWRALIVKEEDTPHEKETSQKKYSQNHNLSRLLAHNFRFNLN